MMSCMITVELEERKKEEVCHFILTTISLATYLIAKVRLKNNSFTTGKNVAAVRQFFAVRSPHGKEVFAVQRH